MICFQKYTEKTPGMQPQRAAPFQH
jgi:hypothetical protein